MNLMFWRKEKLVEEKQNNDPFVNKHLRNFIIKAVGLIQRQGAYREDFQYPEYDLEEIRVASLSDSYIKQALMKYSYLIFKAGTKFKSENELAVGYVKKRLRIMSFATKKPIDILFQEIGDDLTKYSNAFLVKSRVDIVMPGIRAIGIFGSKPIGGYYRVCPASIFIKRDKHGQVQKYQQIVNGEEKIYLPSDVIHFYLDKEPNNTFGTPRIIAAMEDVKLLRKIEGNVISLIYRFAIPIYQWMIGLPEVGFQATDKEINEAKNEIEKIAMDGVIVTNERTTVKAIGAEGVALDASSYLKYFEKRVFTALGVSESQMGRGGSKQDADSMEAMVHDTVKHIQRTFSIFVENYIINELLLEGGFNPILNEKDIVSYEFEEINLDTKVKVENHEMLKFQSNVSTIEETRRNLGKKEEVNEARLYSNMIDSKKALDQIQAKTDGALKLAKARTENEGDGIAGNGRTQGSGTNNDVKNRNMPSNQHGTVSVRIKEHAHDEIILHTPKAEDKEKHKKTYEAVYKKYDDLRNDICRKRGDAEILIPLIKGDIVKAIKQYMYVAAQAGTTRAAKEASQQDIQLRIKKVNLDSIENYVDKTVKTLLKDIKKKLDEGSDPQVTFDAMEYRLRFLLEYVIPKAHWYAYIKACQMMGIKKVFIDFGGSDDAEDNPTEIDTNNFSWEDIPAYHAFCDCEVTLKAGDDK